MLIDNYNFKNQFESLYFDEQKIEKKNILYV